MAAFLCLLVQGKHDIGCRMRVLAKHVSIKCVKDARHEHAVARARSGRHQLIAPSSVLSPEVLTMWRTADAVCFDVDSTVCTDEGIDELAAYCGAGEAVAAWTTRYGCLHFGFGNVR